MPGVKYQYLIVDTVPMVRAGMLLEARPPAVIAVLVYRLSGRPWPLDAGTIMDAKRALAAARSSLTLIEPRLTKAGRRAAEAYSEAWEAFQAQLADKKRQDALIAAAKKVTAEIEEQARKLMRP